MTYIMQEYDEALRKILSHGVRKPNRTGIDTIALSGIQSRYNIGEKYPLLTGRKVWPKAVLAELLWFLSGSTNNNDLVKLGANFWTPWVSKEFEDKWGGLPSGEFGPIYGYQLRNQGGDYILDKFSLGEKTGFDQLAYMQDLVKNDKYSRRILFSLWNGRDLHMMRLPPCHYTFQIIVDGNDRVSGILTQRSCDFPIGVPANIQFYSTLTLMFAAIGGFEPHEFIHNTNDSHIYLDQIDAVEEYLGRPKPDSPTIKMAKKTGILDEDGNVTYTMSDFEILNYNPMDPIKIPVAV